MIELAGEARIAHDEERAGSLLGKGRKGRVEIAFAAGIQDENLLPKGTRRRFRISYRADLGSPHCSG